MSVGGYDSKEDYWVLRSTMRFGLRPEIARRMWIRCSLSLRYELRPRNCSTNVRYTSVCRQRTVSTNAVEFGFAPTRYREVVLTALPPT
jgi:hypothetical protein